MAAAQMWTSKLGNKFPKSQIEADDRQTQAELKRLRSLTSELNNKCADCGSSDNSWASVTHGVFLCIVCSDVHRSVGTHITKMKGCSGTYLWGPDELKVMQEMGNRKANQLYGSEKVAADASKEAKQRYVLQKYQQRRCVEPAATDSSAATTTCEAAVNKEPATAVKASPEIGTVKVVRHAPVAAAAWRPSEDGRLKAYKADIPDDFFDSLFGEDSPKKTEQAEKEFKGFNLEDLLGEPTEVAIR